MNQATEKQINYIEILKEQTVSHIGQEWSVNFFASQYFAALENDIGQDAFDELDDIWAHWPKYHNAAITRVNQIDAGAMTKKEASKMIDLLKSGPGNFIE